PVAIVFAFFCVLFAVLRYLLDFNEIEDAMRSDVLTSVEWFAVFELTFIDLYNCQVTDGPKGKNQLAVSSVYC
ncbi:MAG: Bax inhibitor-1/YccA family protein, partial [Fimbriimonadaceae bacterium]